MNNKVCLVFCMMGLSGCSWLHSFSDDSTCFGPNCNTETEYAVEEMSRDAGVPEICQNSGDPTLCAKDPFVNFTRTPADFRRYGERTPRDQRISQAAAGNNLSASIPPSIEDEVVAYQEKIGSSGEALIADEQIEDLGENSPAAPKTPTSKAKPSQRVQNPDASLSDLDLVIENECLNDESGEDCVVTEKEILTSETDRGLPNDNTVRDWFADEGQNLKALLTQWSEESGWRLVWNTNRNYVLSAGAIFRGRFTDVSSALIRAFARARPAPIATFYNGNRVLVVETMEDENAYD